MSCGKYHRTITFRQIISVHFLRQRYFIKENSHARTQDTTTRRARPPGRLRGGNGGAVRRRPGPIVRALHRARVLHRGGLRDARRPAAGRQPDRLGRRPDRARSGDRRDRGVRPQPRAGAAVRRHRRHGARRGRRDRRGKGRDRLFHRARQPPWQFHQRRPAVSRRHGDSQRRAGPSLQAARQRRPRRGALHRRPGTRSCASSKRRARPAGPP